MLSPYMKNRRARICGIEKDETAYLLSTEKNRERLMESIKQANIKPKSDKLKEKEKEYKKLAKEVLKAIPTCQVATDGCTGAATELHHRKGRGVNLLVRKHLLPVCRNCHTRIENDPQWALDNNYSISRHKTEKE